MTKVLLIIFSIIFLCFLTQHAEQKNSIVVFAAASTGPALNEFAAAVEKDFKLSANIAASSIIARQIINGASCDFVLLADSLWMDELQKAGKIDKQSREIILSNRLVVVTAKANKMDPLTDFAALSALCTKNIALADPASVPAGRYAQQALKFYDIYDQITKKLLVAADVRQALLWAEQKYASCAVVYESDAVSSKKVKVIATFPAESHEPINYEFAKCLSAKNTEQHQTFLKLFNEQGRNIFAEKGFVLF